MGRPQVHHDDAPPEASAGIVCSSEARVNEAAQRRDGRRPTPLAQTRSPDPAQYSLANYLCFLKRASLRPMANEWAISPPFSGSENRRVRPVDSADNLARTGRRLHGAVDPTV